MLGETRAALTQQADARKSRDDQRQQRQRKLEANTPSLMLLKHKSTPCSGLIHPQNTDSAEQTHTSMEWVLWAPLCLAATAAPCALSPAATPRAAQRSAEHGGSLLGQDSAFSWALAPTWLQGRRGAAPGAPPGTCRTQCHKGDCQALGMNLI